MTVSVLTVNISVQLVSFRVSLNDWEPRVGFSEKFAMSPLGGGVEGVRALCGAVADT